MSWGYVSSRETFDAKPRSYELQQPSRALLLRDADRRDLTVDAPGEFRAICSAVAPDLLR
jgi:hypothetical protein